MFDLPTVDQVDVMPAADVPAFVAALGALAMRAAARWTPPAIAPAPVADSDVVTTVAEVAALIHRSVSWVRKHGHRLPGFSQPGGKGTKVAWSRRALVGWVNGTA